MITVEVNKPVDNKDIFFRVNVVVSNNGNIVIVHNDKNSTSFKGQKLNADGGATRQFECADWEKSYFTGTITITSK